MTLKLFVADDSATIQKIVSLAFSDEDVAIEFASRGDAALDSVQVFKPDIILADVFMPGCSGYEVCARIKEDPELAETPVILLSGTFEPFDESEAARVKCDGFLMKPFDTSELIQMVHSLVADKMMPQQSEPSVELPPATSQASEPSMQKSSYSSSKGSVSARVRESYLGSDCILELFDQENLNAAKSGSSPHAYPAIQAATSFAPGDQPSEDFLNLIVDRVVRRMSSDVIREVAWEVVPELSEVLIRRSLEERNKS
jgi:CheY-like chemotaxis protein